MKIAYLADGRIPSGAAHCVQVLHMASALAGLGHEVTMLAPWHASRARGRDGRERLHSDFALGARFRLRYVPYISVGGRLGGSLFGVLALGARVLGADLVYTRSGRAALLAARLGLPVVLESHSLPNSPRSRVALAALALAPELRRWVFISERLRELMAREIPIPAERTLVEHDAVDLERFAGAAPALRFAEGTFVVGHVGHMYKGRGVEHLVEIAARRPGWRLLLVGGTAADVARVGALVGERRLDNVTLTGHRPPSELPGYLAAAGALVMPYTSGTTVSDETTLTIEYASPMKLFEYLAAGRPIVATRWPAIAEVLADGENALLVAPDSADALLAALDRLAASPALGVSLAEAARATAAAHTWQGRAARICEGLP